MFSFEGANSSGPGAKGSQTLHHAPQVNGQEAERTYPHEYEEILVDHGVKLLGSGTSDEEICTALVGAVTEKQLSDSLEKELLARALYRLGAYPYALSFMSSSILNNEETRTIYLECLIRCGKIQTALGILLDWRNGPNRNHLSTDYREWLDRLLFLVRYNLDGRAADPSWQDSCKGRTAADLIHQAIQMGLLETAEKLAEGDTLGMCELIQALYAQGYVEQAKAKLSIVQMSHMIKIDPPFREIAYIYAELLHDEGNFNEAASMFESIADRYPHMAKARFAASSCYLHITMNRLLGRLELYRPSEEEQRKIEKYLTSISQALQTIHTTNWHTSWTPAQKRNLSSSYSAILQ